MSQEYVTVQVVQDRVRRRVRMGARKRRVVAVALAVGAVIWATFGTISMVLHSTEDPLPMLTARTPDVAKTTALVYQEWANRVELVECLQEHGFAYEPRVVEQRDSLELVAQYLGVEPATAHPEAPLPMLRQPDLYLGRGGSGESEVPGQCSLPDSQLDVTDSVAVEDVLASARSDGAFLETIAEQVWTQRNPAQVSHHVALMHEGTSLGGSLTVGSTGWAEQLTIVTGAIQDGTVWVPLVTAERAEFAQSVGLVASGGAVVVRVGDVDFTLESSPHMSGTDFIRCGPTTMSAAVKVPWGAESDLQVVMDAMTTACNALIGAGFIEAETLADVYWN